jgi:hypothetical protein
MPPHRVVLSSGLFALALAVAQSAVADGVKDKADDFSAKIAHQAGTSIPAPQRPDNAGADVGTITNAGPVIVGSVTDGPALTNGQLDTPLGDGFDAEKWELDETLGKPIIAITDRGLAEKGHPEGLSGLGADTASMQRGLSLEGAATPQGAMASSPVVSSIMGSLKDVPGL